MAVPFVTDLEVRSEQKSARQLFYCKLDCLGRKGKPFVRRDAESR